MTVKTTTKRFPLGAALTWLGDVQLCETKDIYLLANFLTGRELLTHELIIVDEHVKQRIQEQYPVLQDVILPNSAWFTSLGDKENVQRAVDRYVGQVASECKLSRHIPFTREDEPPYYAPGEPRNPIDSVEYARAEARRRIAAREARGGS